MFDETTIQTLIDAVGWDAPINTGLVITSENLEATTGRLFNSFHSLVTVENVNETAGQKPLTIDELNAVLYGFKKQAALQILAKIFNNSPQFNPLLDYGGTVVKYLGVIVEAYGMQVAANTLLMMSTSLRTNETERRAKYGIAKVELEGVKTEMGVTISRGVKSLLYSAIIDAQTIIFPKTLDIYGDSEW